MPTSAADTEITYIGNGVTVAFPFPFEVSKASHFEATIDGAVVTAYTLSGLGVDTGGTCSFTDPPDSLAEIVLARVAPYARTDFDYQEGGELAANTLDEDIDRAVMLSQQLATTLKRVPQVKRGDLTKVLDLTPEDGTVLGWAAGGLANLQPSTISPSTVLVSAAGEALVGAASAAAERIVMGADFAGPSNISLSVSAAAGALTIALKGDDGADHSTSNPGLIVAPGFPNLGEKLQGISITTAQSIVIPSTATLGALANVPFRVWVVAVNINGTMRLGVINPLYASAGTPSDAEFSVGNIPAFGYTDSKDELTAAGSDFAETFYFTGGASGAYRPYTLLGYCEFWQGLSVPGTWVAPTAVYAWRPGMPTPGQVVCTYGERNSAVATGVVPMPIDDTIPQKTEGNPFIITGHVAASTVPAQCPCNLLRVDATAVLASSNTDNVIGAALFFNTDANAVAAAVGSRPATADARCQVSMSYVGPNTDAAVSGSPVNSITLRAGTNSAGTTTFNGSAGARTFGGRMASHVIAQEIMT